ncbi:MAG TPA: hypothetical protein V6C88_19520, partial [Chroococcidiopsis sp.]
MVSNGPALEFIDALMVAQTGNRLSAVQRALLSASWSGERQSYDQIAESCGYSPHYLRKHVGPQLWQMLSDLLGEKVTKINCRMAIARQMALNPSIAIASPAPQGNGEYRETIPDTLPHCDWGEAADVDVFYGRQQELETLLQWTGQTGQTGRSPIGEPGALRCRLIGVFGVGGIGKTHLSIKLAQQVTDFDCIIWRSLRNAPPLTELLADLLHTLTRFAGDAAGSTQPRRLPDAVSGRLSALIEQLRSQRCLLVLDNAETLLRGGDYSGHYRDGYDDYGQLLKRVGETQHGSCLLLTSREKPQEFGILEGATLPVRSLYLKGLSPQAGGQILGARGIDLSSDRGSAAVSSELVYRYGGNPLALKIVSTTIQELFDGNIAQFLQQEAAITDEISELLDQHFVRLAAIEQTVLYWLAVAREPITLSTLCDDWIAAPPRRQILDALKSLGQRSLIEKHDGLFSLQPVVMEYVSDRLTNAIRDEIIHNNASFELLNQHTLLKAEAKDYIRDIQIRLLLK